MLGGYWRGGLGGIRECGKDESGRLFGGATCDRWGPMEVGEAGISAGEGLDPGEARVFGEAEEGMERMV